MQIPIHIIYASTGGNTQHVIERVAGYWDSLGLPVVLHRAEQTSLSVITQNQFFLFATSTWEHGVINPFFNRLLGEMKTEDFSGKVAACIGLGDRRYEPYYFCEGIRILERLWKENSGLVIGEVLTIGREPFDQTIEAIVRQWTIDTGKLYQTATFEHTPDYQVSKEVQHAV